MLITFGLFWAVIKNNLLYCVRTGDVDGGGLFFPNAINQLFTGLYFMEFCLIGLFFLVTDTNDNIACKAQGIIMAVVLVLTILYQVWLMNHLGPLFKYAPVQLEVDSQALLADYEEDRERRSSELLGASENVRTDSPDEKEAFPELPGQSAPPVQAIHTLTEAQSASHLRPPLRSRQSSQLRAKDLQAKQHQDAVAAERILARLNRPLNEARLAHLEDKLAARTERATGFSSALLPRRKDIEAQMLDDPISKIMMQHHDELENLGPQERDMLLSVAFMHPVLRETSPSVWIPRDDEGVCDDEIQRTRELSGDVVIDSRGAYFDSRLKVQVDRPPPDMSEFALIIAEL